MFTTAVVAAVTTVHYCQSMVGAAVAATFVPLLIALSLDPLPPSRYSILERDPEPQE